MHGIKKYCHYHPEKLAETVCERCGKPICIGDKRIYHNKQIFYQTKPKSYYKPRDYCVLCKASQLRDDANPIKFIVSPIILGFLFFIIGLNYVDTPRIFIVIVFTYLFISLIFVVLLFKAKNEATEAEKDASRLKTKLYSNYNFFSKSNLTSPNQSTLVDTASNSVNNEKKFRVSKTNSDSIKCSTCGSKIGLEDIFCQNCGEPTSTELAGF